MDKNNKLNEEKLSKISGGATLDGQTLTDLDEWFILHQDLLNLKAMYLGLEKEFADFLSIVFNSPEKLNIYSSVEEFKKDLKDKIGMDCDDIV